MKYLTLVLCFIFSTLYIFAKSETDKDNIKTSCTQDTDCILVLKGCCSCNNGGTYLAIHKSQKDSYESKLKKRCSTPQICKTQYRCNEWEDKPRCISSKCSVIEKTPPE